MAEIEDLEDEFGDFEEAKGNIHEVNAEPLQEGTQNQENEESKREESNPHSLFQEGNESRANDLFQEEIKNQSTEIKANKEETEKLENEQFVSNPELVLSGEILQQNENNDHLDHLMNDQIEVNKENFNENEKTGEFQGKNPLNEENVLNSSDPNNNKTEEEESNEFGSPTKENNHLQNESPEKFDSTSNPKNEVQKLPENEYGEFKSEELKLERNSNSENINFSSSISPEKLNEEKVNKFDSFKEEQEIPTKEDPLAKSLTESPPQDIQKKAEQDDYEFQKNCLEPEIQVNQQLPPGEELKEIEDLEKKELQNKSSGTPQKEQIEKQESEDDFNFGEFKAVEVLKENPEQKGLEQNEEDKKNIIEPKADEIEKYQAIEEKLSETPIIDQEKKSNLQKNEPTEYFSESNHDSTQHEPPINYDASAKNEIKEMEEKNFEESKHLEHNIDQQEAFIAKKSNTSTPVKKNENEDLFGNFTNKASTNLTQDDEKLQIHTENLQTTEEKNEPFKEKTADPISYILPTNEESNQINAANKVDEFAELNDLHIPQNGEVEKDTPINPLQKKVEFDPKNEDETEKTHNSPKEEVDEDEFGDFKVNSGQEPQKIIEETKETQDVSKAISNKNQENGGNDEDELDFGDFNFNTVTNTAHEDIQATETQTESEGTDLFGKSKLEPKADDLFGSDNTQQSQAFNFSNNFGFSTNFSSSFSTNFGNFNFNQTTIEQKKELVIEKEKKEESDDDMFGEDKTNFKKTPESPLFGEEEKKTGLEENTAKKEKKTDFSLFGSSMDMLATMLKRVSSTFLSSSQHPFALTDLNQEIQDECKNNEDFKHVLNQANAEKLKREKNLLRDTLETTFGILVNKNLEQFLEERKHQLHSFKENIEEKMLTDLVSNIKQTNWIWKTSNLRSSFLTTLNIQDDGNDDDHNELETEHQRLPPSSNKTDKKGKITLKIEKKLSNKNNEMTSPLIPNDLLKDMNKMKKKSSDIPIILPKKLENKANVSEEEKSVSIKNGNEMSKKQFEPNSPIAALEKNDEENTNKNKKGNKYDKKPLPAHTSTKSSVSTIKNVDLPNLLEQKNKSVQIILKSLPQYDFLFADRVIYKMT